MSEFQPGDRVRVNGDDRVWTVSRNQGRDGVYIDPPEGDRWYFVDPAWLIPVVPLLHPAYADAQPGDVVRVDGSVWVFNSTMWWQGTTKATTAELAALDPNPVRLVPLPSVDALAFRCNGSPASIHAWLADRERGK